jgi:hypothetical protein
LERGRKRRALVYVCVCVCVRVLTGFELACQGEVCRPRATPALAARSTGTWGAICLIRSLSDVKRDLVGRGWRFCACPAADSFSAGCQTKLEEHPRLALYAAALVVGMPFVVRVAGWALCYGESNNLT